MRRIKMFFALAFVVLVSANLSAADGKVVASASGRVEPASEERRMGFNLPGRIKLLDVKEGQKISKGDILAELENGEETAAVKLAEANLAIARANVLNATAALEKLRNGARQEERLIAKAELKSAQSYLDKLKNGARKEERDLAKAKLDMRKAELNNADRLVKRIKLLRSDQNAIAATQEEEDNAIDQYNMAKAAFDQAKANYDLVCGEARVEDVAAAEAKVASAKANLDLVDGDSRKEDIAMAEAHLAATQAEVLAAESRLDRVKSRLDKTRVISPLDGTVLKIYRRRGEQVRPTDQQPVMTIGDISSLMVRVEVDESDIGKIKDGQGVRAEAKGIRGKKFYGKVTEVLPSMGRKKLYSNRPGEKIDTEVREVLVKLDKGGDLPVGLRLDVYFTDN